MYYKRSEGVNSLNIWRGISNCFVYTTIQQFLAIQIYVIDKLLYAFIIVTVTMLGVYSEYKL